MSTRRREQPVQNRAIIVGINEFEDKGIFDDLLFAEADAQGFAELLINDVGWRSEDIELYVGSSLSKAVLENAIEKAFLQLPFAEDSLLLFYYAGHGFRDERWTNGYLAVHKTQYARPVTGISMSWIVRDCLLETKATNAVMILDCCHSGAAWANLRPRGETSSSLLGLDNVSRLNQQVSTETDSPSHSSRGNFVLASCRASESAWEPKASTQPDGSGHGMFTQELINAWRGDVPAALTHTSPPYVTFDSLYFALYEQLYGSPQTPQRFGWKQEGSVILNSLLHPNSGQNAPLPPSQREPELHAGASRRDEIVPEVLKRIPNLQGLEPFTGWTSAQGINDILPPMVVVPDAGEFEMGGSESEYGETADNPDANKGSAVITGKADQVRVATFEIGLFPVTVAEYACFLRWVLMTSSTDSKEQERTKPPKDWDWQSTRLNFPVTSVSWDDAVAYGSWLSAITGRHYRLASEAEWEKAARWDPRQRRSLVYPWGDIWPWSDNWQGSDPSYVCNVATGQLEPVGKFVAGASPYGVQDLTGNVWEWTSSLLLDYPFTDNSEVREDPQQPGDRVIRGSSYADGNEVQSRAAYRSAATPTSVSDDLGFRIARTITTR